MCWLATSSSFGGKGHRKKKRKRWVHWNVFVLWDISLAFRGWPAYLNRPAVDCCFCLFVLFFCFFLGVAVSWNKCICILKSCFCQTLNVTQRSVEFDCEVLCSLLEHLWSFSPSRLRHFAVLTSPCQRRLIYLLWGQQRTKRKTSHC